MCSVASSGDGVYFVMFENFVNFFFESPSDREKRVFVLIMPISYSLYAELTFNDAKIEPPLQ